jgi:hypothetical protein
VAYPIDCWPWKHGQEAREARSEEAVDENRLQRVVRNDSMARRRAPMKHKVADTTNNQPKGWIVSEDRDKRFKRGSVQRQEEVHIKRRSGVMNFREKVSAKRGCDDAVVAGGC